MGVSIITTTGGWNIDGVVLKDGSVDVNGKAKGIIFDADQDTYMEATTDDILDIYIAGSKDFVFKTNEFVVEAASKIVVEGATGDHIAVFMPQLAQQALSGAGAITITEYYTAWTTTAGDAATMADGEAIGQLKKLQLIVDGGDGTLTPSNLIGGTTVTFADAGDYAVFLWTGSSWLPIELGNADGATAPVLA